MIEQNQFPFQIPLPLKQKAAGVSTFIAILITAIIIILLVDVIKKFKGEAKTASCDRLGT